MKKIIIFILLGFIPFFVFAQNCPSVKFTPAIEIKTQNLQINQQQKVAYLKTLSTNPNHYPIGLYKGNKAISIAPYYQVYPLANSFCANAASLKLTIELTPIIYISQEAQNYPCTYNRVYEHEMTHFKIEMNAINKLTVYLNQYMTQKYSNTIWANNQADIKAEINKINISAMQYISQFLEVETVPYHQQIDTPENYKKESTYCSYDENVALMKLISGQ